MRHERPFPQLRPANAHVRPARGRAPDAQPWPSIRWRSLAWTACGVAICSGVVSAQGPEVLTQAAAEAATDLTGDLSAAVIRLPLAAVLGAALALRPKRTGTPERSMPVIETQIILAIVGALIMLIVGASLARAFGIVGAANLIRYRAKIDDPKDAVVMLCALAVGLASGVGLYPLAVFGTLFTGGVLWAIESFEPVQRKTFELSVKAEKGMSDRRTRVEQVLRRLGADYEIRTESDDVLTYVVTTQPEFRVDRASAQLTALGTDGELAVEWDEKGKKKGA